MVAIDGFLLRHKRFADNARQRSKHARHHHFAVMTGKILRPFHRLQVVVVMLTPFLEVGQVSVRQVGDMLLHILLGQRDKHIANGIPHATRTAVQHHPYPLLLIQAHFNEVVTGTQCSQVLVVIGFYQSGIFIRQSLKARRQLRPVVIHFLWRCFPRPFITFRSVN
ncbi:hypothetical protein ACUY4R_004500 [Kosakonia sp. BK9b]